MIRKLESYFDRLWPINRSITGNGNRQTLKILSEIIDLKVDEILSGTKCFDWVIPDEWNVKEATYNYGKIRVFPLQEVYLLIKKALQNNPELFLVDKNATIS